MRLALTLMLSYLLGSIPVAVWMGKIVRGIDIRDHGSGNAGATNALRVLGAKYGVLVLALDMVKGLLAVLVVSKIGQMEFAAYPNLLPVLAGSCAILGHVFPVTTGFRGGKGVGTAAGVMLALAPVVTLCVLVLWAAIVAATRYVSVASMVAAISVPLLLILRKVIFENDPGRAITSFSVIMALAVLIFHHGNIGRLLAGKENKLTLGANRTKRKQS
ncbi:glycerol-3-phosphate 1-O-acyltransferase PlsY [bacterium]|nr:glycerol-3-phosphate 1-O-acyltransferase PlsY [bacterium]